MHSRQQLTEAVNDEDGELCSTEVMSYRSTKPQNSHKIYRIAAIDFSAMAVELILFFMRHFMW